MSPVIALKNVAGPISLSIIYVSLFIVIILDGILIIFWIVPCCVVTTITSALLGVDTEVVGEKLLCYSIVPK